MVEVRLVPMTEGEYRAWVDADIREYAQEHVRTGEWPADGAEARAREEFVRLLPNGITTPDQFLFTVRDAASAASVGIVWFQAGKGPRPGEPPKAYVYDLVVHPEFRGKGYGEAAMRAVEVEVRRRGFHALSLHVFGHNAVARSLYEKLGYVPVNLIMKKTLAD